MPQIAIDMLATQQLLATDARVSVTNGFTSTIRNNDVEGFNVGDAFVLPASFEGRVCRRVMGKDEQGNDRIAEFIVVNVNGQPKQFYPSSLTKTAFQVDHSKNDGVTIARIKAGGNVAAAFKKAGTSVQEGMNLLAGRMIKVTNVQKVWTRSRFGETAGTDVQSTVCDFHCDDFDTTGNLIAGAAPAGVGA